jgi:hypothetical protein
MLLAMLALAIPTVVSLEGTIGSRKAPRVKVLLACLAMMAFGLGTYSAQAQLVRGANGGLTA